MRKIVLLSLTSLLLTACSGGLRPVSEPGPTPTTPSTSKPPVIMPQPGTPSPAKRSLEGDAYFEQSEPLPPTAKLTVSLHNAATGDTPSGRLAQRTVFVKQETPIPFRLDYDPSKVKSGQRYAISARVLLGGRPLFLTPKAIPVQLNGTNDQPVEIKLTPVR
ncbi:MULTISPECIES: YbaY family lipoprotein [Pseudomonas]|jgi:putative lipoprotein|uniref:YbaY family lipoprotein n=2 Tax=Pseudomonas TaxID=286 RepID=A0ABS0MU33_PSELU|nr:MULTISPECIES: YbaY family lipoprotein [Pseudomonas]MBH3440096.1 YbaY family lipoprotein [Pseudomonas luteola]MCG7373734.1 YbaY family lipoprotein [Pseudomonas luteola]SER02701.1 putative lipoprotein [Pseudomonas lutea]